MATITKGQTFAGGETVTADKLNNLVDNATIANIVDADIGSGAAIALSKLATGALPTAITVASANLVDDTIVNADVNASAAIAGTKIAPDFGSQNVETTGTLEAGATTLGGNLTLGDNNIVAGTTTGVKVGTATTQKIGFWNATPVDQPAVTADLLDSLQEVGLIASGAGNTPLNLTDGAFECGTITSGTHTLDDAANIVVGTTTGTKIGTGATQKIGFWDATPAVQPAAVADLAVTFTANAPSAADGSITVADGSSPTVGELLEYCVELEAKLEDLLGKLRTIGLIAT